MLREDWSTGWQQRAACRGDDSVFFFAPSHFEKRAEKNAREAVAKSICAVLSDWLPATTGSMIWVDGGLHATGM